MKQKKALLSKIALLSAVLALLWLVTGCASSAEVPDAVEQVLEPTAVIATATIEATVESTPEPEEAALLVEAGPDTCTDCHTDKDLLIDTADPEEEVISENEGEG